MWAPCTEVGLAIHQKEVNLASSGYLKLIPCAHLPAPVHVPVPVHLIDSTRRFRRTAVAT